MTEMLFKARWTLRQSEVLDSGKHDSFEQSIAEWLRENDRQGSYVNSYINTNTVTDTMEFVVVLRDRDTALMMKLALG